MFETASGFPWPGETGSHSVTQQRQALDDQERIESAAAGLFLTCEGDLEGVGKLLLRAKTYLQGSYEHHQLLKGDSFEHFWWKHVK